ncbi:hypothetical protein QE152_g39020 [Popillia japonica]|uniref:Uncharacterized protein n=1 Tax=Popillia japonica TaxID=7064 RepID=A0AAW1HVZ7_POPJA
MIKTSNVITRSQKTRNPPKNKDIEKGSTSAKCNTSYISITCAEEKEENTENNLLQELRDKLAETNYQLQELREQNAQEVKKIECYKKKCSNQDDTIKNLHQVIGELSGRLNNTVNDGHTQTEPLLVCEKGNQTNVEISHDNDTIATKVINITVEENSSDFKLENRERTSYNTEKQHKPKSNVVMRVNCKRKASINPGKSLY